MRGGGRAAAWYDLQQRIHCLLSGAVKVAAAAEEAEEEEGEGHTEHSHACRHQPTHAPLPPAGAAGPGARLSLLLPGSSARRNDRLLSRKLLKSGRGELSSANQSQLSNKRG